MLRVPAKDYGKKYFILVLFFAAILVNIKSVFADCDVDVEYAVALSYRMLQGDQMLLQMWEPHQTSAFLCAVLMKPFLVATGGTTGIIIYLHLMGVLIHGVITRVFYCFMKVRVDLTTARLMSIFFLAMRPKDIVFPEFSNMQIWFSVLLFLCLIHYLEHQERKSRLLFGAFFLCLEVISYPSCVLVWFVVVIVLWVYAQNKWKDILIFSAACLVQGCIYVGCFVVKLGGLSAFLQRVSLIIMGDASHQEAGKAKLDFYFACTVESLLWVLGSFIISLLIWGAVRKVCAKNTGKRIENCFVLLFSSVLMLAFLVKTIFFSVRNGYVALYLLVAVSALFLLKKCTVSERRLVSVGMAISFGSFIATGMLTNLDLSSIIAYLVLAVTMSFVPLRRVLPTEAVCMGKVIKYDVVLLFCLLLVFQRGVTMRTYSGFTSPLQLGGVIRSGPAMGIVTDYLAAYIRNVSYNEWDSYVQPGENVLIVEQGSVSALGYLYADTKTSAPSVICTPTFDEVLLEYWGLYPEKYPDVVAVQCWYGELKVDSDSWIMEWLDSEKRLVSVEDGTFWRFYRLAPQT